MKLQTSLYRAVDAAGSRKIKKIKMLLQGRKFPRNKTVFIDVQFNIDMNGHNFIKEMAILKMDETFAKHYLVKPPHAFDLLQQNIMSQNFFNLKRINGLDWNCGDVNASEIAKSLSAYSNFTIVVKGLEKKLELEKYLTFTEIVDLGPGFSLKHLPDYIHHCPHHNSKFQRCAINNVFKIRRYVESLNFCSMLTPQLVLSNRNN